MSSDGAPRIIHTAQALVDEVVAVDALPRRGQNAVAHTYHRYAGGAVNILLAAARSGAAAVHAGAHGTGPNGDLIRAALTAEGVTLSAPKVRDMDTGICFVMVEPSAERTFVTTQGAERHISAASLQTAKPVSGDLVCVSGYSLLGLTKEPLLEWLGSLAQGVTVVLDPGAPFGDLPAEVRTAVLAKTTVLTGNAEEAAALAGSDGSDWIADALQVAGLLGPDGVVIVRDGPQGCVVHAAGQTTVVPGFPRKPLDTNGAGDVHTGVLCACRAAGLDWLEAARRANAAGAIKVTRRGPDTAPTANEIDEFLAQLP